MLNFVPFDKPPWCKFAASNSCSQLRSWETAQDALTGADAKIAACFKAVHRGASSVFRMDTG